MLKNYLFIYLCISILLITSCAKDLKTIVEPEVPDTEEPEKEKPKEPKPLIQLHQALFTAPEDIFAGKHSYTIINELVKYLDAAIKGSSVKANIYLLDSNPIIQAFLRAHSRGVNIEVMIDNSREDSQKTNSAAISNLRKELGTNLIVLTSDASPSSINHHKHILFSEIVFKENRAENVVFSTSHNFIAAGSKKIQDAVILSDQDLYDAFLDNWKVMLSKANSGMKTFEYTVFEKGDQEVHFFPRRRNGNWDNGDTVIDILNGISDYENSSVQIGMSDWVDSRVRTAEKLVELQEKGVKIEVVAKNKADAKVLLELEKLKAAGGNVTILDMNGKGHNIHSKFILIEGMWRGTKQTVLINGTHNFTTNALQNNNEVILILKNDPLFGEYQNYFKKLQTIFKN